MISGFRRLPDPGLEGGEGSAHGAGAKQENAGIPIEAAGVEISPRGGEVGLLDEARDVEHAVAIGRDLDIAIAGFGLRRLNPEHHQATGSRRRSTRFNAPPELPRGGDFVVGGHHENKLIAKFGEGAQAGKRHGSGGVAPRGLEQWAAAGEINAGKIGMDAVGMALRCDEKDRRLPFRPRGQPAQGLGQHRTVAGKVVELLGIVLARQGP